LFSCTKQSNGFYAHHHIGGGDWFNNTAYRHRNIFNMLSRLKDNTTDVPEYAHTLRNNRSYKANNSIVHIDFSKCILEKTYSVKIPEWGSTIT